MDIYTIDRKISNSGTIHDLASDQYDRIIKFKKGFLYAVVLPAFYGDISTTHKTEDAAIRKYKTLKNYNPTIIDCYGQIYGVIDDYLVKMRG